MKHYNVQIQIQCVEESEPGKRKVAEVLKLAVSADTEREAYAKAHRMLTANEAGA